MCFHLKPQFCEQVLFLKTVLKEHSHPQVKLITLQILHICVYFNFTNLIS